MKEDENIKPNYRRMCPGNVFSKASVLDVDSV